MVYANNATLTTALSGCGQLNVTQTVHDLYDLYRNNSPSLVSNVLYNISIMNFSCQTNYFQQIITFTNSVSIQIQVALASVYFDYIAANTYSLNGFFIDPEALFNLSSITLNYSAVSSACLSGEIAGDPLCPQNSLTPLCVEDNTNPWIFNCSEYPSTSTISFPTTDSNDLLSTTISSILQPWQIGLVCSLSVLVLLFVLIIIGHFIRRYSRSKRIALSRENLFENMKSLRKRGVPLGQAFQRTATIVQPMHHTKTAITWVHDDTNRNYINLKPPGPYNQATFIDHAKVHDPVFPSTIPPQSLKPIPQKLFTSGTSSQQLRSITDQLDEKTIDESDSISLDRSNSTTPKKPSTPVSRQFANTSFVDESLRDEDAWMSILAVADAELDVLNRLESEQNQIRTTI